MWRNLFFLAGIPAIVLVNINAFYFEDQHPPRAEFKPFEHMRKRQKVKKILILLKLRIFHYFYTLYLKRDSHGVMVIIPYFTMNTTMLCQKAMKPMMRLSKNICMSIIKY